MIMSTQPNIASLPLPITPPASPPSTDSNHIEDVIAGAFSGTVSRMITAPLDVLKIRSQLHFGAEAPSMFTSLRTIVKEEGISALWKGNLSATYLWITYGMAQFLLYGIFKSWGENQLNQMDLDSSTRNSAFLKTLTLFAAGATAGMVGFCLSCI